MTIRRLKVFAGTLIIIGVVLFSYKMKYDSLLNDFENTAQKKQSHLGDEIQLCTNCIETLTVYGNGYFENNAAPTSDLYSNFTYNAANNSYNLDKIHDITNEKSMGNITGIGEIPTETEKRNEIILALQYYQFFSKYYDEIKDFAWIYYISENDFLSLYPWVDSSDFAYKKDLKQSPYYVLARPENNPSRANVWTPVYMDQVGKGLMVTLSAPIYDVDEFKGVVSIDLTNSRMEELIESDYDGYLLDIQNGIIATDTAYKCSEEPLNLKNVLKLSDSEMEKWKNARVNTLVSVKSYYIYKSDFQNAPWVLVMAVPKYRIIMDAFLFTIPVLLICLLLAYSVLQNRLLKRENDVRKKAEETIREIATTDQLTGLRNRHYLEAAIQVEFSRAERYKQPLSIIMMDLDHFKRVNDSYGHPVGDEVLKQTAETAGKVIRKSDIFVRFGGEEFIILLPKTDAEGAHELAEKIRIAMEEHEHEVAGKVTASLGFTQWNVGEPIDYLLKKVDDALYFAKSSGRNRVVGYEEASSHIPLASVNVKWSSKWDSGDSKIDEQHKGILDMVNNFMVFSLSDSASEDAKVLIEQLISHITTHFEYEEQVLRSREYPHLAEHMEIHKGLLMKILRLKESCDAGDVKPSVFIAFMVDDVVVGHLMNEDVKFFPYTRG